MKLRRTLVFSTVIVSLTLVALAAPGVKTFNLKFKGQGAFAVVVDPDLGVPVYIPAGGYDLLNVSHFGLSKVEWKLLYEAPEDPPFGWFTITGANGDMLMGYYSNFDLNSENGEYELEWTFTGGTGRFEGAQGLGYTDGLADLSVFPPHAEFEFLGTITVPKGKALITNVVRDGVTEGQPSIVAGPNPGGFQEGSHAYMDRPISEDDTRNYHWESIPTELVGADYVMTYCEDKQPVYDPEAYNVSYSVTLGKAARLYIFIDRRYVDAHGDPPFAWLTDGSSGAVFEDTGLDIILNEVGGREVLQPFDIYGAEVRAGTYILGPSCDGNGGRGFYSIAAAKK